MNFQALSKEQKQMVMLGGIVGITLIYAGLRFGLMPLMQGGEESDTQLDDLVTKVDNAERMIKSRRSMATQYNEINVELKETILNQIPSVENPLAWATERIYKIARNTGVNIESVSDATTGMIPTGPNQPKPVFKPYAVRVVTKCSYPQLLSMLKEVEESNPLVTVSGISIAEYTKTPMKHRISFNVEWPYWQDPTVFYDVRRDFSKEVS